MLKTQEDHDMMKSKYESYKDIEIVRGKNLNLFNDYLSVIYCNFLISFVQFDTTLLFFFIDVVICNTFIYSFDHLRFCANRQRMNELHMKKRSKS